MRDAIEVDDRVLLLVRDRGRRLGTEAEVELPTAAVWTVADGKVRRIEFFTDRERALDSVGLPPH